ncbi:MAG: DUF1573 domain-containing protein [Planctomycetota bacterium]
MRGALGLLALVLAAVPLAAQARLEAPVLHEAGIREQGESFEGRIRVENRGDAPLRLLEPRFACLCADGAFETAVLAPGAATDLVFRFRTAGLEGKLKKAVTFAWMDAKGKRREHELAITVDVRPAWSLSPPEWRFGEVDPGALLEREFALVLRDEKGPEPRIAAEDGVVLRDESGRARAVRVVWRAPSAPGPVRRTVTVRADDPARPEQILVLTADVRGALLLTPRELRLGVLEPGRGASRVLVVTSRDGRPFRVRSVASDRGLEAEAPSPEAAAARHAITVRVPADLPPGGWAGTLTLDTDRGEFAVPFRFSVRKP